MCVQFVWYDRELFNSLVCGVGDAINDDDAGEHVETDECSALRSGKGDGPRESAMWTAWVEMSEVSIEISPSGLNSAFWRDLSEKPVSWLSSY